MINEVEGLSVLTLHDSHANLFDVLIAWLFTLEGRGEKNRTVGFCNSFRNICAIVESKSALKYIFLTAEESTLCGWC